MLRLQSVGQVILGYLSGYHPSMVPERPIQAIAPSIDTLASMSLP